jgi:hypothetical protein
LTPPFNAYFGDERAVLGLAHQDCRARVPQRSDTVHDEIPEREAGLRAARQSEAADPETGGAEDLNSLAVVRCISHNERSVGLHGEGRRIDDVPWLGSDLDDLPGARLVGVDSVDGVSAAIEHVILPGARLLEADGLAESAGDAGGNGTGGAENLWTATAQCGRRQKRNDGWENRAAHELGGP